MIRRSVASGRGDAGNASIVLVLVTPALFGVAGLVVDGGRAINARQLAASQAEQAARAAADAVDVDALRAGTGIVIDPVAARAAAERYLAATGSTGAVDVGPGTVTVTVSRSTRTAFLALIGMDKMHVTAEVTARPALGVVVEESS